jgi:hypothetical protein
MAKDRNKPNRPTKYKHVPLQTESLGTQRLQLDIGLLFVQSRLRTTADALGLLIDGDPGPDERVAAIVRKHGLTKAELSRVRRSGKAMPRIPSLENDGYREVAQQLEDLANPNGSWRRKFDTFASGMVNEKVSDVMKRVMLLVNDLAAQYDIQTAIRAAADLVSFFRERVVEQGTAEYWKPNYSDNLMLSSSTYQRFDDETNQKTLLGLRKKRLNKEARLQIRQQFDRDLKYVQCRTDQLNTELQNRIASRLIDVDSEDSLPCCIRKLERHCESLKDLQNVIRKEIKGIKDSETVTNVVHSIEQKIGDGLVFYDLVCGAFSSCGCGPIDVARKLRGGVSLRGTLLSIFDLARIENNQAKKLLYKFASMFFTPSIESVYRIDLTESALQLPLAKAIATACEKASPFLRFGELNGIQTTNETYLHSHPDVRKLVEAYRPGLVNFSNPQTDSAFHLPEKHVLVITTNVLGPGHTRSEFKKGRYARDQLIGEGTFKSIHPFDQQMAQLNDLATRPVERRDSVQLFDLALKYDIIVSKTTEKGRQTYSLNPIDETVRFCFETEVVKRRVEDAYHFSRLLEEPWFIDFVDANVDRLPVDWSQTLFEMLDSASGDRIATEMVSLEILEKQQRTARFRIRTPYRNGSPKREELYRFTTATNVGLPRKVFIDKLVVIDELYARVLEDVISAQAQRRIPYRKLTAFAKRQVDERKDGLEL